jgi:acetyltransferase
MSHTGALAGPDIAVDALFRKCGITRCSGREEFLYTAGIMMHRKPAGKNFAVITHAGGPGVMATDALSHNGLNVPQIDGPASEQLKRELFHGSSVSNPIDFIGTGTAEQLDKILDFIDRDCPGIDSSIVIFGTPGLFDVTHVYDLLDEKMKTLQKPVFPVLPSTMLAAEAVEHFIKLGRVFFPDEVMLAKSLAAVSKTNNSFPDQGTCNAYKNKQDTINIKKIISGTSDGFLSPGCVRKLLHSAVIPHVRELSINNPDEIEFAAALGFPLVMKVSGPVHKSDVEGVKLNISSIDEAKKVYSELMNISCATGVVVQQMISGIELFIGAKREPGYGHIILCGLGGIFVETLKDISAGIVPVGMDEALDMIRRLKGYGIIKGARGKAGVSEERFAEIITCVSSLLSIAPEIKEIDLNPLIGEGERIQSVDCRIFIDKNI